MKLDLSFLKPKKKIIKDSLIINPNRYWLVVVYVSLFMIFISFAFGFYLFLQVSSEPELEISNFDRQTEKIKKSRIEKVLEHFNERKTKATEILNSPTLVSDPSVSIAPSVVPSVGIEPTSRP